MTTPKTLAEALRGRRFGLVLSAGYFGFFGHAGLLQALEAEGLQASALSGTSAGALVAAFSAAGLTGLQIGERLAGVRREDFWDPHPVGQLVEALRGRGATGLLRGRRFRALLQRDLPVRRIEECARPLVLVTSDVTNATSRVHVEGELAAAVHASCAYPGLFRTVDEAGAQLWDGGLVDKAPLVALAERVELDALLVHYLPGETQEAARARPRRHGYVGGLAQGLSTVRHEHYVLQGKLCEARGLPVYELSPRLPRLGPTKLARGPEALAEAARLTRLALAAPADERRPFLARAQAKSRS